MLLADTNSAETGVCNELEALNCPFKRCALPVGDFRVDGPELAVVIERKRVEDYRASILDGRLRCQKQRMIELIADSDVKTKCIVVVEGNRVGWSTEAGVRGVSDKSMSGSFLRSFLRDEIACLFTATPRETAMMMMTIVEFVGSKAARPGLLGKRPRSLVMDSPVTSLLVAVPGVGKTAAVALAAVYPTAAALVAATPIDLAATQLSAKRKLGPKIAATIKTFFN